MLPNSSEPFEIEEATIADLQQAIRTRKISCVELIQQYLNRIHKYEFRLNSITYLNPKALQIATELDRKFAAGEPMGPLFSVPILLKDNINTFDMPTTNGSIILKDAVPTEDAYITANLRQAGAVILGKASMGEFANNDYNTIDGVVTNAYSRLRSTSGSSSGCAAALTANLALLAVGTDTSSSIRGPAAFAGLVGLRPTTGLWSRSGIAPKSPLFDTAGPMARNVTDLAALLGAGAGRDEADPMNVAVYNTHPAGEINYTESLDADALKGARLGLVHNFLKGDPEVEAMMNNAIEVIGNLGATIVDIYLDTDFLRFNIVNGAQNLRVPADADFKKNFEDYLSTYFGPHVPKTVAEFVDIYRATTTVSRKPVEQRILDLLETSLKMNANNLSHFHLVNDMLPAASTYKKSLFDKNRVGALIYPTSTSFPPPINTPVLKTKDPTYIPPEISSFIFASYSSIGNPDITVPMGLGTAGLPAGISFMGRPYDEATILGFAYAFEQATNLRVPPDLSEL
ncbi:amidase family protein [Phyllobacterium sp. SB3]|uniref:amidase family protein n=1 Tax=Phyllobacterium sp. SB3 TaxID=3156073 RepID=UPI0032AFADB3